MKFCTRCASLSAAEGSPEILALCPRALPGRTALASRAGRRQASTDTHFEHQPASCSSAGTELQVFRHDFLAASFEDVGSMPL